MNFRATLVLKFWKGKDIVKMKTQKKHDKAGKAVPGIAWITETNSTSLMSTDLKTKIIFYLICDNYSRSVTVSL